jgi:hypothetical protein
MKCFSNLLPISAFALAVMIYGCKQGQIDSDDRTPDHSHLQVAGRQVHLWTYLTVVEISKLNGPNESVGKHYEGTIEQGETYKLSDGTLITNDGTLLKVGGTIIPEDTLNLVIDIKGNIHLGNFIRTFR